MVLRESFFRKKIHPAAVFFLLSLLIYLLDFTSLFRFFKLGVEGWARETRSWVYKKKDKATTHKEKTEMLFCEENWEARKIIDENRRLRQLLQLPVAAKKDFLDAWVVGRKDELLVINRGEEEGVFLGQKVIYQGFLLGRVEKLTPKEALVLPVGAARFSLPVIILDSRPECLLQRQSCRHGKGLLRGKRIEGILLTEPVNEGDGVLPLVDDFGLLVGKVAQVKESKDHVFKEARLELPWRLEEIDQVFLIKK